MDEEVAAFAERCDRELRDCQRFCFMARAKELQIEARSRLERLEEEARALKEAKVACEDEDSANAALSLEAMTRSLVHALGMWVAFKEDESGKAWDHLVRAQNAARTAMRAHALAKDLDGYVQRLHAAEQLLFPSQMFFSPGMVVERAKCSICDSDYSSCAHLVGKPYMGKICTRVIEEVKELNEVSFVYEPADKLCRIYKIVDEGVARDYLTWRVIPDTEPNG